MMHESKGQQIGLDLPNEYTLGHCGLSTASRHKLASTSTTHSYMTRQHSTKLLPG